MHCYSIYILYLPLLPESSLYLYLITLWPLYFVFVCKYIWRVFCPSLSKTRYHSRLTADIICNKIVFFKINCDRLYGPVLLANQAYLLFILPAAKCLECPALAQNHLELTNGKLVRLLLYAKHRLCL